MSDANEMVVIEISKIDRDRLWDAVVSQATMLGYDRSLDLGLDQHLGWPRGKTEITFSQLVVLARKLKMRITICELKMTPL